MNYDLEFSSNISTYGPSLLQFTSASRNAINVIIPYADLSQVRVNEVKESPTNETKVTQSFWQLKLKICFLKNFKAEEYFNENFITIQQFHDSF